MSDNAKNKSAEARHERAGNPSGSPVVDADIDGPIEPLVPTTRYGPASWWRFGLVIMAIGILAYLLLTSFNPA